MLCENILYGRYGNVVELELRLQILIRTEVCAWCLILILVLFTKLWTTWDVLLSTITLAEIPAFFISQTLQGF